MEFRPSIVGCRELIPSVARCASTAPTTLRYFWSADSLERTRLRGLEDFYLINIDHHISGRAYAHLNWIDCEAASVGELGF